MNHMIPLEINVISAQLFKNVNFFSKVDRLYTVVELLTDPSSSSASVHVNRTKVSKHGESGPFWWSKIIFQIEESKLMHNIDGLWLTLHVKCPKTLIPDKVVGTVRIPVSELLDYYYSSNNYTEEIGCGPHKRAAFTFCSSRSGKPRGVLYLSYMFGSGEHKGIMKSGSSESLFATNINPSAPYIDDHDDIDFPVSTQNCDEKYRRYDSFDSIPSAPYLSDEDLE